MLQTAEFWVALAFVAFFALIFWKGVPTLIGKALDSRADAIRKELEEARKLKDDAEKLLADYEKRRKAAAGEAEAIISQAKEEATALAAETRNGLKESLERRTRLAEDKIARAETQAAADVRAAAVEAAVAAAERLLGSKLDTAKAGGLIDQSIRELKTKLG
ncbi:MAG: F0F1 ATP synthase subunit B [Hyphomicrobiaceae bacterium]